MAEFDRDDIAARFLHARVNRLKPGDPIVPPIVAASMFHLPGSPGNSPYHYGRFHNPTWEELEAALSVLEGADTIVFPSGMAAIAAMMFCELKSGDKILLPADGYYTSRILAEKYLRGLGVETVLRSTAQFLRGGFAGFRLVLVETPSNPGLDVCDIGEAVMLARQAGALVFVDNTTMTPLGQRPLDLGADAALYSDTKALNGHSDVVLGHIATRDEQLAARLREWRKISGSIPGPFETWLALRGLETLEVRFERMCMNAATIAERLAGHKKIVGVRYPGLAGDPAHAIAARQMNNFGFMLAVTLETGIAADRFIAECSLLQPATSFGSVRSSAERRARWGEAVPDGFLRVSIGIEPLDALWRAMNAALAVV